MTPGYRASSPGMNSLDCNLTNDLRGLDDLGIAIGGDRDGSIVG